MLQHTAGEKEKRPVRRINGREQDRDQVPPRHPQPDPRQRQRPPRRRRPNGKALSTYITERFDEFSRSQKDVARYIVDHLDEAAFQTAEELARRANTSSSTVVRFSQALGFEGYPELQQAAIEEYRSRAAGRATPRRRCSTSTTPSSRPRSPPTTPTSRRRSATSPASRSRPASPRSPPRTG